MRTKVICIFCTLILLWGCAKIPSQSVTLMEALIDEGSRMHKLNIALVDRMFNDKKESIDHYIKNDFTPTYLANFSKTIPADADVKADLPEIIDALVPPINERRDKMHTALEEQRVKLLQKLNADYEVYMKGSTALRDLLYSAAAVSKERQAIYTALKDLSENKLDLNQIEDSLDKFIVDGGDVSKSIVTLNESINSLIKK